MKDPALMTKWERTYWLIRLRAQLFLNDAVRWVRRDLLRVPRDEVTEEWLESMSPAELEEFLRLAEGLERREGSLQKAPSQPVQLSRSIFDHKDCGRFLDRQLNSRAR